MFHLSYRMSVMLYNFIFIAVSTYSNIPCIVRHILSGLYIIVHWVFVSSCIRIWVLGLNNISCQYNIPWHKMCRTLHPDKILFDHILSQMIVHTIQKYKQLECVTEEIHYCILLLLQQFELVFVWCFVFNKLPENGTFMPNHIQVGT